MNGKWPVVLRDDQQEAYYSRQKSVVMATFKVSNTHGKTKKKKEKERKKETLVENTYYNRSIESLQLALRPFLHLLHPPDDPLVHFLAPTKTLEVP